jgi:GMP synthase (glutamine-hydrolysing)
LSSVLILDFGSQYTQLIARRVREERIYCEILPFNAPIQDIRAKSPQAIILSGGPAGTYDKDAPALNPEILELGAPILGICYGLQALAHALGGAVAPSLQREYGRATLDFISPESHILAGLDRGAQVWMSHGDRVLNAPDGFQVSAYNADTPVACMENHGRRLYGVQFHPEVAHTPGGRTVIRNFLINIAGMDPDWNMRSFIDTTTEQVNERVGAAHVVAGLSGGVDSSVMTVLLHRALGERLHPIFVNNGLLRKDEADQVRRIFEKNLGIDLIYVDASDLFLKALSGIVDPEEKRKVIGELFIRVFEAQAGKIPEVKYLAQGTLYPDVIESVSFSGGPSVTIKSHHNVGGLPERMDLELIEPLRELFKDEVRVLGAELGLPEQILWRHPFPGPGLAVRILGEVTPERVTILQKADHIAMEEIKRANLYRDIWQAFVVLLPIRSVGVMGDGRTYENVAAFRAVQATDGMTADWFKMDHEVLGKISNRIINEVKGINRVVYDISSKPPSTIEWE